MSCSGANGWLGLLCDDGRDELETMGEHRILTEADVHALVDSAFDAADLLSAPKGPSRSETPG